MQYTKTEKFKLRKSKRYKNLVSLGLGVLFATVVIGVALDNNSAHASELTENPATNLEYAQESQTEQSTNSQAKENTKTGNIDVEVDNTLIDNAVEQAKKDGLLIEKEDDKIIGTATNEEEREKLTEEIINDYKKQIETINNATEKYKQEQENYKNEVDRITKLNDEAKEQYNKELEEYKIKKAEYDKKVKEAEEKAKEEGYLKKPIVQNLIYKDEPNASARIISGGLPVSLDTLSRVMYKGRSQEEIDIVNRMLNDENKKYWASHIPSDMVTESDRETIPPILSHLTDPPEGYIKNSKSYYAVKFKEGETISVEYTGLENSSYAGKKITKTIQEYTFSGTNNSDRSGMAYFFNNPNGTILATSYLDYSNRASDNKWLQTNNVDEEETFADGSSYTFHKIKGNPHLQIKIKIRYFDENGQEIQFTEDSQAALSISSISSRRYYESTGVSAERAKMNGELVEINGSIIKKQGEWLQGTHSDYREIAAIPYESKGRGLDSNPDGAIYKISGAGIITPGTNPEVTIDTDYSIWFYINSEINAKGVLDEKVTPPKEPEYKEIPINNITVPKVKYNYNKLNYELNIEKTVINSDKEDINGKFVNKQAEVSFPLNVKELPINREKINKFEIIDNLPKGYELNIDKTIKLSSDYDVTYDKNIHTIIFKAKQNMLDNINKNLTSTYKPTVPVIVGTVLNDGAVYKNNYKLIINDYEVYSNTVKVITPGDNPTPETPDNSFIKPTKENTNKDGVNIDGKTVLPNSINYYKLKWDLDQYKGIKATKEDIAKGFYFVDDFPEEALNVLQDAIKLVDKDGKEVTGVEIKHIKDINSVDEKVKEVIEKSKIKINGEFLLFSAKNPQEFFEKYVKTGTNIYITAPMEVKKLFVGEYENKAYQIDFGNGYYTEVVVNNVPKLEVSKQVIDVNGKDINNGTVALNEEFEYKLDGAYLPSNRSEKITQYDLIDDYDEKGDEYKSYKVFADVDIKLKDDTTIKKGTDITEYTEEIKEAGKVTIKLKSNFLEKVSLESEFDVYALLKVKRIAVGTFENTYVNVVNGNEIISNTVKTTTPEPVTPKEEKPTTPTKKLSSTGETTTSTILGGIMALFSSIFLLRRKRD